MTEAQTIHLFRLAVLEHAATHGNVSETCRQFKVSRKTFYKWRDRAARYGTDALMPKPRRAPQMPNATPTHVVERLLTHAAMIAALTSGLVTEPVRDEFLRPGGFCHWAAFTGDLLALDGFYIGNLKGVGRCYQLTAVDVATRWAMVWIVAGPVTAELSTAFLAKVVATMAKLGVGVRAVVTDNGPEFIAHGFRARLAELGINHVRIPARSPNHNAVVERFQGTMLQEGWRPAFHRRRFITIRQLQAEADAWLTTYNTRRRNHSAYMDGRTPAQMLDLRHPNKAA